MANIYEAFLGSPSATHLAADAALHYITTTTSVKGADAILKHIKTQAVQVQKKSEQVLGSTVGGNGIYLETETTYVFRQGGGSILPGMDINMLADMTVTCPMVHAVTLDGSGKISQIRIYWDQGTILKQVEAIGKTGRNWPIRDGKEQTKVIKASIESIDTTSTPAPAPATGRMPDEYTKRLFDTSTNEPRQNFTQQDPRESLRPSQRQWSSGFPDGDDTDRQRSPERRRVDPTKGSHFEWGNGEDAPVAPSAAHAKSSSKQISSWDINDVSTPPRVAPRHNPEQERHIGYGQDPEHGPTPAKRPIVHAPRPDAKAHFELSDAQTPEHAKIPLATRTNVNAARRNDDYGAHFEIKDAEPENRPAPGKGRSDLQRSFEFNTATTGEQIPAGRTIYKTAGNGMGGRKGSSLWDLAGDDEPEQYGGKGGVKQVYKTAGNGMGGRKGQVGLGWSIGDPDLE